MRLIVPGEPVPKKRPRILKSGHVYTPRETVEYESSIAWSAKASGRKFEKKAMQLEVDFFCSKFRVDTDNLVKSVCDGLQASGVLEDDVYIVAIKAYRWEDQNNPRTEINLEYITQDPDH